MGKRAKSLRHLKKMQEKREQKRQRAALYARMAEQSDNSKRRGGKGQKSPLRKRDERCKNIGDLRSHPELIGSVIDLIGTGMMNRHFTTTRQYTGKYKGLVRKVLDAASKDVRVNRMPSSVAFNDKNLVKHTRNLLQ